MKGYNTDETVEEFIKKHGKPYDPENDNYFREPFAKDTKVGKNNIVYNVHKYHTKVPPEGIMPYLKHYSDEGDIIADPFCGSGMTGVAAIMAQCNAIISDLSPSACHIAYNYCTNADIGDFKKEFKRIKESLEEEFEWLYETHHDDGSQAIVKSTLWSDVFKCGRCGELFIFWNIAVDHKSGKVKNEIKCPYCDFKGSKTKYTRVDIVAVSTNYEYKIYDAKKKKWKNKRSHHEVTQEELDKIKLIEEKEIPYWYPNDIIDKDRDMYVLSALHLRNIETYADFYTKRNLWALSALWNHILNVKNEMIREKLKLAFTSILDVASKRNRWPQFQVLGGTLFIPSISIEMNVFDQFERKIKKIVKYLEFISKSYNREKSKIIIYVGDAQKLSINDDSIDYIFTDPPFGSNIFYADCSVLWESWLEKMTDRSSEAVISRNKKNNPYLKTIDDYTKIMDTCFREMYRVLKPGRWASVVFSNSDDRVWQVIREGVKKAGFELTNTVALDKKQRSFKQLKGEKEGENVVGKDIIMNLHKKGETSVQVSDVPDLDIKVLSIIKNHTETLPEKIEIDPDRYSDSLRATDSLYNVVIQELMNQHLSNRGVTMPYINELCSSTMKKVDGKWYLPGEEIRLKGKIFVEVKDERTAIEWLHNQLEERPLSFPELVPEWRKATLKAGKRLEKSLQQLLEENFWYDSEKKRWRLPTSNERLQMGDEKTLEMKRNIRKLMDNKLKELPGPRELLGWLTFAYQKMGDHKAVIEIYQRLNIAGLAEDEKKKANKIYKYCLTQISYEEENNGQTKLF